MALISTNLSTPETVLFESESGILFVRKDFKNRSQIIVKNRDSGCYIMDYRIKNVPLYVHRLLSWENLNCCGGWRYDKEYEKTAVQHGLKPAALIVRSDDYVYLTEEEKAKAEEWHDPDTAFNHTYTLYRTIIARKGCLNNLFDMDDISAAYGKLGICVDIHSMQSWLNMPVMDLMRFWWKNDYVFNPGTKTDLIITGLMLGYPIESTAGLIFRHRKYLKDT